MIALIRWILIAPLTVFTWLVVFAATLSLYTLFDTHCPSGYSVAALQDTLLVVGASLSAILVVFVATLVAPTHKARVAVVVYLVGLSVATWMLVHTDEFAAFAGAAFCGFITAWIVFRRCSRRPGLSDGFQRRLFG